MKEKKVKKEKVERSPSLVLVKTIEFLAVKICLRQFGDSWGLSVPNFLKIFKKLSLTFLKPGRQFGSFHLIRLNIESHGIPAS